MLLTTKCKTSSHTACLASLIEYFLSYISALNRSDLIRFAFITGSDYTEGIQGWLNRPLFDRFSFSSTQNNTDNFTYLQGLDQLAPWRLYTNFLAKILKDLRNSSRLKSVRILNNFRLFKNNWVCESIGESIGSLAIVTHRSFLSCSWYIFVLFYEFKTLLILHYITFLAKILKDFEEKFKLVKSSAHFEQFYTL